MKTARSLFPLITLALAAAPAFAAPMKSDPNLLTGLAASPANFGVSSYFNDGSAATAYGPGAADYGPQNATNGTGGGAGEDFVFDAGDGSQRAAITGFNSAVTDIKIWSGDLKPLQVTIESSTTSKISISPGDYETTLVPLTTLASDWVAADGQFYADFVVSAPAGTKSLFFNFGTGQDTTGNAGFARISELQAFVPEPASLGLLGLGGLGLLARRRRD